ncbi:hypothetical protein LCGC14_2475230 [marine sediment metagenome]|uniref:Uncharacterized protein n=1 Tax=marine sediment metagenome TaxID=412755 RepID=A0A0F9E308_9ZZZZ
MIKEITTFVANQSVALGFTQAWTIGTNLFAGHVPVKNALGAVIPVRYLSVLENAGGAVLTDVGGVVTATPPSVSADPTYWPKYIEKAVQLLNRAKSYFIAHLDAEELYEAFHNRCGWNLPDQGIYLALDALAGLLDRLEDTVDALHHPACDSVGDVQCPTDDLIGRCWHPASVLGAVNARLDALGRLLNGPSEVVQQAGRQSGDLCHRIQACVH